jgi:hypothetical protein
MLASYPLAAFEMICFICRAIKQFSLGDGKTGVRVSYYVSGISPEGTFRLCVVPEAEVKGL